MQTKPGNYAKLEQFNDNRNLEKTGKDTHPEQVKSGEEW